MSGLRCSRCDAEDSFYEEGEVTVDASRDIKVSRARDGSLAIVTGSVETEHATASDFGADGYACSNCGARDRTLEELVRDNFHMVPGQLVVLPDGLKGVVAEVDDTARTVTVEGWHEEFKWAEVQLHHGAGVKA